MIRFFDVVFSSLALLFLSPLFLPVCILLRCTGEGEVFYIQTRVGFSGQPFGLIKFATMLKNSSNMGAGDITVVNDPRVLPIGRFLRKTKINELPQLLNIFLGDMSVIGPRPLTRRIFSLYPEELKSVVTSVKPGLSGVGSIIFRDEEALMNSRDDPMSYYQKTIAPYKARLEEWFVRERSLFLYFKCIAITALVVVYPSTKMAAAWLKGLPEPSGDLMNDLLHARQP